ncbi:UNVERIFIED_CONTAM: hypothetical protein HHA_213880 [Hammondia hammondi]|eukprot:XP_008884054.1 hypothetical protein HHA_213880 [Hammondia hammondi]
MKPTQILHRLLCSVCSVAVLTHCAWVPRTSAAAESSSRQEAVGQHTVDGLSTTDAYFSSHKSSVDQERNVEDDYLELVDPAFWDASRYLKLAETVFGVLDTEFEEALKAAGNALARDRQKKTSEGVPSGVELEKDLLSELEVAIENGAGGEAEETEEGAGDATGEAGVGGEAAETNENVQESGDGQRFLRRGMSHELREAKQKGARWLFDSAKLEDVNLSSMLLVALSVALEKIPIPDLSFLDTLL